MEGFVAPYFVVRGGGGAIYPIFYENVPYPLGYVPTKFGNDVTNIFEIIDKQYKSPWQRRRRKNMIKTIISPDIHLGDIIKLSEYNRHNLITN